MEAVQTLAERAGINWQTAPANNDMDKKYLHRKKLIAINHIACEFLP